MRKNFIFTSESVTEGHPDKLCDRISDAIVDRFLERDPFARVIAECAVSTSIVFIAARFAADRSVDCQKVARKIISESGYDHDGFSASRCSIVTSLSELPSDKKRKIDERELTDRQIDRYAVKNQATVFGYACNQTPALMPLPVWLAHRLARRLSAVRKDGTLPWLCSDGKTQVAIEYKNGKPKNVHSITVIASQDESGPGIKKLSADIQEAVIGPVFKDEQVRPGKQTRIFVNPDGLFVHGGPSVHSGLTGRKGGIDTYGEFARQSGAALSGKCPIRIDRVGAYAARYAAKNVVAAGLAEECEIQLSYSIGAAQPVSIQVETFGTGSLPDEAIAERVAQSCDFRLAGIIRQFSLRFLPAANGGFYQNLAVFGHMGRTDLDPPWEKTDIVEKL